MYRLRLWLAALALGYAAQGLAAGALALDANQGSAYGFAYDYATVGEASERALSECGGNCRVVETFEAGCAAYAADQAAGSTAYGWANADSSGEAQSMAMQYCQSYGGTECLVRVWGCNSQ